MASFNKVETNNYCIGIGNVYVNGVPVGGTEGDLVLVPQKTVKNIENVAQKPGVILDTRNLGNSALVRFTMSEAGLMNIQKALDSSAIATIGTKTRTYFGSEPETHFTSKFTLSFYCESPGQAQRKFYAYKAGFVDPGEINFSGDNFTKIAVTLRLYPDELVTTKHDLYYIEDGD